LDLEKEVSASGASLWQALKKLDYTDLK
jgi:hypothetical protein